jgi:Chromo (CHRromatin Organisation MOdifier) domain
VLSITQNLSTTFHPQTDMLSERKNQWIEQYLRLICSNQDQWSKWLPVVTAIHNNTRNSTTGFAPNTLLLGWEPPLTLDQIAPTSNQKTEDYITKFQKNHLMAILALNKVTSSHAPMSSNYKQGQHVWLEGKKLPLSHGTIKLSPKRYRPFIITKLISPVASQLSLPMSWNIHLVFHNSLLTPFIETSAHGPNFTRPPPDLIDGEAEYEGEAIRSCRHFGKNKRLQYLLKWKGYPEVDNTWESEDQLNAPNLPRQYNKRHSLEHIKTRGRVIKLHPLSPTSSWLSTIPTHISTMQSILPSPSSTIKCRWPTYQMSLPPPLCRPRLISPFRSTPSPTPSTLHPSPPITSPYHRKLRSTSSRPNQTSTRRSTPLPTDSFQLSTARRSPMRLKLRSAMKQTESCRRGSNSMQTRLTASSSSPAAPTVTSQMKVGCPHKFRSARGTSLMPSLLGSEMMVEPSCWRGRSIMKIRTPLTSSSHPITHCPTLLSQSPFGSTPSSMAPLLLTTHSIAPSPISMIGMQPPKSSSTNILTTDSNTSTTSSLSFKLRSILLKMTSHPAATASKPRTSHPAF